MTISALKQPTPPRGVDPPTHTEGPTPSASALAESITKEFNYANRCRHMRGKLWCESYGPEQELYANLVFRRNERVMAHCRDGERLLDIGCGLGDLLYHLRDRYKELHGAEPSADMARHAADALEQRGVGDRVTIRQAAGEEIAYPENHFDTILMLDTYEHVHLDKRVATLEAVRRSLKPGREFILVTPSFATIHAWALVDNILTLRRQIKAKNGVRILATTPKNYTEIFVSKRRLLREVREAGFVVKRFERVGFYPAPERPGFLEPALPRIYKNKKHHARWLRAFRAIERMRFFNQKMLVVAEKPA